MRESLQVPRPATVSVLLVMVAAVAITVPARTVAQSLLPASDESATRWTVEALKDLSAFSNPPANWQVVGDVVSRRTEAGDLQSSPGTGYVAGTPGEDLQTRWNHGDIELDFEVLVPAGTETEILLQGRYALNLSDSWGGRVEGGRPLGSVGESVPTVDVARAPGLWQHVNVLFRAPRFDRSGRKTGNAEFVRVAVNGVVVQDGVGIDQPSPGAVFPGEAAEAPLVFRSEGGPIAFRKVRYQLLDGGPASVANVGYNYYRGDFGWEMPDVSALRLVSGGPTSQISSALADTSNRFALQFSGDLLIPASGSYLMEITSTGQFTLEVDGQTVVDIESPEVAAVGDVPRRVATVNLARGRHSFVLTYARGRWHRALSALGWYISGSQSIRTRLTGADSDPGDVFAEYKIEPSDRPRLQRNFVAFGEAKRTHAISVGYPNGNHYAYDTGSGALLYLWRGRFIDTSTMWFSRGNQQSAAPRGSLIPLAGEPVVQVAGEAGDSESSYRFGGYRLDEDGIPAFNYTVGSWRVVDRIAPDASGRFFARDLTLTASGAEGTAPTMPVSLVLAEASKIRSIASGVFDVGEGAYYVETESLSVELETIGDVDRIVVRLTEAAPTFTVRYNIVW